MTDLLTFIFSTFSSIFTFVLNIELYPDLHVTFGDLFFGGIIIYIMVWMGVKLASRIGGVEK